jgi:Flp pilus assembly CpaF family ATPase
LLEDVQSLIELLINNNDPIVNGGLLVCGREGSGKTALLSHLQQVTSRYSPLFASK